jgi:hypothetical protein
MNVPQGEQYRVEIIDPWEMTITPLDEPVVGSDVGGVTVPLPEKPYLALRMRRVC